MLNGKGRRHTLLASYPGFKRGVLQDMLMPATR